MSGGVFQCPMMSGDVRRVSEELLKGYLSVVYGLVKVWVLRAKLPKINPKMTKIDLSDFKMTRVDSFCVFKAILIAQR